MKYLLLGASGFLGSIVKAELLKIQFSEKIKLIAPLRGENLKELKIIYDLSKVENLMPILEYFKPDTIINCSAKVDFENIYNDEMHIINTLVPKICASYCKKNNVNLVHASSVSVYEEDKKIVSLKSKYNNKKGYSKTKLEGDLAIIEQKIKYSILRFPGIWSSQGPNHLGINLAINNAINNKIIPTLFGDGNGKRNYIFLKDAAKCIIDAALNKRYGIFICAPDEYISIKNMLEQIAKEFMNGDNLKIINPDVITQDRIYFGNYKWIEFLKFKEALKLEKRLIR